MIKPTVGRITWYYPAGSDPDVDQPLAAIVTKVNADDCVNLTIFTDVGATIGHVEVPLVQDDEDCDACEGHYCTWMPFQKGQASKTEAAEKQLAAKCDETKTPAEKPVAVD